MGIVTEDIAEVRAVTDMVALVSEYTPLKKVGARYVGLCPFHSERSASFSLNAEEGLYYCFGCQASGDAITFLRAIEGCDFVEAVERLAARAGVALRYDESARAHEAKDRLHALREALGAAAALYHESLVAGPGAGQARQYLRSRGYDSDIVRRFHLGWAPGGTTLVRALRAKRVPDKVMLDTGLARESGGGPRDVFYERVIFPIFDPSGSAIALGGRLLPGAPKPGAPSPGPKYRNSSESPLYSKRRTLYGLNWARQSIVAHKQVVVCEGYTDVIGLFTAGVPEAVATCGTALTEDHLKILGRFARRVVLAFDADAAGQNAAARIYDWERRHDVEVAVAALPPGRDPADLAKADPGGLKKAVDEAAPFLSFLLERALSGEATRSAEARARAAEVAVQMIAEHPNELVRDQYLVRVADRTTIDAERLRSRVEAARRGRTRGGERAAPPVRVEAAAVPARQAAARRPVRAPGRRAGRDALVLAIHDRSSMAGRLDSALFADPVQRRAFIVLDRSPDIHQAIESADDEVAEVLRQLAVTDPLADADQTIVALARSAATGVLKDLEGRARQADATSDSEGLSKVAATIGWLKGQLEAVSEPGVNDRPPRGVIEAADSLVAWLGQQKGEEG